MVTLLLHLLRLLPMLCGCHRQVALENLALRHQLAVYKRMGNRPKLLSSDRLFWVALSRVWAGWRQALVIVSPNTVLRWQRRRFREYWARLSAPTAAGRPRVSRQIRALVVRLAQANPLWGAPRIHGELQKLGIDVAERTVSRLLPKRRSPRSQTWRTFLTTSVTSSPSTSSRFPPRGCAFCSSSSCSLTIADGSSISMSLSIRPPTGPPSRSWRFPRRFRTRLPPARPRRSLR